MSKRNPSMEFICQALTDYAATLAPSVRLAFTAFANKHVENVEVELSRHLRADPVSAPANNWGPETKL